MNHKIVVAVVGIVLTIVAAVFDVIGCVAPYWTWIRKSVSTNGTVINLEHNEGLWRYCLTIVNVTSCGCETEIWDHGFTSVQAMETLVFCASWLLLLFSSSDFSSDKTNLNGLALYV